MSEENEKCNIYLITPQNFKINKFIKELELIFSHDIVKILQIRIKH